ncbi:MAG: transcriptional repressor [Anaerolineae bacterium]|nr:transcriptional repressor [Anaerolineae bacterium]
MSPAELDQLTSEWLDKLQESGYRRTDRCEAIVRAILASPRAMDPMELFDEARKDIPRLGLVTVYRTIQKLADLGLVERLHQEEGCHRVLPATQGHQHFLVCSSCGTVTYFAGDNLAGLFETIAAQTGFEIQEHWLQLFGLCPACRPA